MNYQEVPAMQCGFEHNLLEPNYQLETLLQELVQLKKNTAVYRKQIQKILQTVQRSPDLWRPDFVSHEIYQEALAHLYSGISYHPLNIPQTASMDWVNQQLKATIDAT